MNESHGEDEVLSNGTNLSIVENTTAKLPPMTASADNFLAIQHGMDREYSIVDHILSERLSNAFDEEYCPGQQCVGVHSGEIGFNGSQERFPQINSKLLKSRVWSPRLNAGHSDLDHKEYFYGHNAQSQILRFSEEELLELKDKKYKNVSLNNTNETLHTSKDKPEYTESEDSSEYNPQKKSSQENGFDNNLSPADVKISSENLDEVLGNLRSSYEVALKTVEAINPNKPDQDEHCLTNDEQSYNKISVVGLSNKNCKPFCKFSIPPGCFPFMAPFLAMIGKQNYPVDTSSSEEDDKQTKDQPKEETLQSETDEKKSHDKNSHDLSEGSTSSGDKGKHKKHKKKKEHVEEKEDPNVTALFEAIRIYQSAIEEATPIRDSLLKLLEKFYDPDEKRVTKKTVAPVKEKYKAAYLKVKDAKITYMRALTTLGYGVKERAAVYENASDLEKAYKEMHPEVFDCGTKEILINLEKDLRSLMESMPLEELEQFVDLLDDKPEPIKSPPLVPVDSETGEIRPLKKSKKPKKLKKNKPDHRSFPDCLELPGPSKKSLREFRLNLLKDLTERFNRGPDPFEMGKNMHPLYTFGFKIADKKKQLEMDKVVKTANILLNKPQKRIKAPYILASTPYEQGLHKSLHYASALDGRRDFREIVGVNQLKALWPILMKLDIGKRRVNPDELFKYVKESGIGEGSFTFDTAVHICQEWKKGRRIDFEEAIFAVHNPKLYVTLCSTGQLNELLDEIKKWHTHVPSKHDFAQKSLPRPRSLYGLPKRKNSIGCIYTKPPTIDVSAGYKKNAMKEYSQHVLKALSIPTKQSLHRTVTKAAKVRSSTSNANPISTLRSNSITSDVATVASFKNPNASQDEISMDNNADYNVIIHHDGYSSGQSFNFGMEFPALNCNPKVYHNDKTSCSNSSLPKIINDEKITSNKKNQPCNKNVTFKNVDLKCNGNANRCARDSNLKNKGQCKYQKLTRNLQRFPKDLVHRHSCLLTGVQNFKPAKFSVGKKTRAEKNIESLPNLDIKYRLSDAARGHNKVLVPSSGFCESAAFAQNFQLPNINTL